MVELSRQDKKEIVQAIERAESHTSGQIRVHIKKRLKGDVLEEAKKTFRNLRMHKTQERNAVLVFIGLESRLFAIIGDSGIHQKVGQDFWHHTRDAMTHFLAEGKLKEALLVSIGSIAEELRKHFPKTGSMNELPDRITEN